MNSNLSFRDLIYENIESTHPEYTFGRVKYGDYDLIMIKENEACKIVDFTYYNYALWTQLHSSQVLLATLERSLNFKKTNNTPHSIYIPEKYGTCIHGLYLHKDLIPHILIWLSPNFAFKISNLTHQWMLNESKTKLVKPQVNQEEKEDDNVDGLEELVTLIGNGYSGGFIY